MVIYLSFSPFHSNSAVRSHKPSHSATPLPWGNPIALISNSNLKLALELAAKGTGREELAALAGQVQELGPLSDETAAETDRLATTLEELSQQSDLITQFEARAAVPSASWSRPRLSPVTA